MEALRLVADIGRRGSFSLRCNAGLGVSDAEQRNGRRDREESLYRFYRDIRTVRVQKAAPGSRRTCRNEIIFFIRTVTAEPST